MTATTATSASENNNNDDDDDNARHKLQALAFSSLKHNDNSERKSIFFDRRISNADSKNLEFSFRGKSGQSKQEGRQTSCSQNMGMLKENESFPF